MTATTIPSDVLSHGELTNTCTCTIVGPCEREFIPSDECFGDCWEDSLHTFGFAVEHLLSTSYRFAVTGLRLWHGPVDGEFVASNVEEFVHGVTVDSSWIMRYRVYADRMEYSLSHHDAPTGSASVVRPIVEPNVFDE